MFKDCERIVPVWNKDDSHSTEEHRKRKIVNSRMTQTEGLPTKVRLLQIALALLSSFFLAELTAAACSHSLSLLADASHVLSDVVALGITLAATWWSSRRREGERKPSRVGFLEGKSLQKKGQVVSCLSPHHSCLIPPRSCPSRIELVAALINGISLVAIALGIGVEAIARLQSPALDVEGLPMLFTAILGVSINGINAVYLHQSCENDLNIRSAFLHVIADVCSSVGVVVAAIAVAWLHWTWADGCISLLVSVAMIVLTMPLLLQSLQLLRGKIVVNPAPQFSDNCPHKTGEKLLFPSLEELITH